MLSTETEENNNHFRGDLFSVVSRLTELEEVPSPKGTGGYYQGDCVLPGCHDPKGSFTLFCREDRAEEWWQCLACDRAGDGLIDFNLAYNHNGKVEDLRNRNRNLGNKVMSYEPDSAGIRAISFRGREKPGPREWIVENAICKGHATSWYGESGIAKSLLAIHMGLHIAADGVDYWAGLRVKTMPVIYGDFELDETEQLRRAQELAAGMGLPDVPAKFLYLPLSGMSTKEAFAIARSDCARVGPCLFITDSVGFALDGDSEMSKDVLRFYKECIRPIIDAGATPHLIDHQAKVIKGEKYSDKKEFGSVYKTNSVRSSFQIRGAWDGNELTATFMHRKNNFGPRLDDFSLKLTFGDEQVKVERLKEAVPNPDREPSKKEQVYEAIKAMGRATAETVSNKTGINPQTVRNAFSELQHEGCIEDTGEKANRYHVFVVTHNQPTKGTVTVTKDDGHEVDDPMPDYEALWRARVRENTREEGRA
jgi:hypothetical protein